MNTQTSEPIPHRLVTPQVFARCEALVGLLAAQIQDLLPEARVEHIGATAVLGLFTKGDLDIAVHVLPDQFEGAVAALDSLYTRIHEDYWVAGEFADYGLPPADGTDISVKLVAIGGSRDFFVPLRDLLRRQADFRTQVNRVKRQYAEYGMDLYREHKALLYGRLLAWRGAQTFEWYDFEAYHRPPDGTEVLAEVRRPDGTTFRILGRYEEATDTIQDADGRRWGWETPEQVRLWADITGPPAQS